MNINDMNFPSRNELKNVVIKTKDAEEINYDYLSAQVSKLNLDAIDFDDTSSDYGKLKIKIEKQKIYFWIRVYLNEEINIEPGDDISIKYVTSGEVLTTKFICFSKKGTLPEGESDVSTVRNYEGEDDTKVLCLMVDEGKINYDSDDIPFIRKLFKIGRYFEYELLRRTDLVLSNSKNGEQIEYYDIEF